MKNTKTKPGPTRQSRNGSTHPDAFDAAAREPLVSFDRTGHITGINVAAAKLFDHSPLAMLGGPLARFIARRNAEDFLHHLLRCRMKEKKVETELHLKSGSGEKIPVRLSSVCVSSDAQGVRFRYRTTIIDLRKSD